MMLENILGHAGGQSRLWCHLDLLKKMRPNFGFDT